ncbi:NUDIX domain-containing protein [Psychrobacter sp. NG27]|uniref:NUDIX domain-containing protein n=1 Tax=Psychrobacter sp. NG27 TaxID=2781966 RepID=UPI0018DF0F30|nr:NUDIX domain-containing protein [Psychrobacter sp. NG27]MBI0425539.1 NUDIX domain-containing protein [Psychrobacter sp. NG27]
MPHQKNNPTPDTTKTIVNVAVGVIHYKNQYLLGFRDATQHQGNRYEFVGGKIETGESATQALIREVAEEAGIAIGDNVIVKLGRLHHDYGDKKVSLQVYKVELTIQQYEQHKHRQYGLEGQALTWVDKAGLLAGEYHLPAANKTILEWLKLPTQITITYPLGHFSECEDSATAWLQYHQQKLPMAAWVYIRLKQSGSAHMAKQLMAARPDIQVILSHCDDKESLTKHIEPVAHDIDTEHQVCAIHLTHTELLIWVSNILGGLGFETSSDTEKVLDGYLSNDYLPSAYPLIVSCHDIASITAANKLADARLQQRLPPVIGAFLSPVLATQTHPDTTPLGWESWSTLAQLADMPVIGLGGVTPLMLDKALENGGVSVAGIREFVR